jgi:excisionase family DNA binding protein
LSQSPFPVGGAASSNATTKTLEIKSTLGFHSSMTLLEALWKSDGHKKPSSDDVQLLQSFVQDAEPQLGSERTYAALLALSRLTAASVRFTSPEPGKAKEAVLRATYNPSESDPLLDKRQMAEWLKVSTRTVDQLMTRRRLPYFRLGRTIRFRLANVIAHLQEKPY